jgi:DNA-binding response OmpR family regulator
MRILTVSKDTEVIDSISNSFNRYLTDFELRIAHTLKECLAKDHNNRIDLAILDLDLIDNSRLGIFDLLKEFRDSSNTIIIGLYSTNANMLRAFELGATQCLLKPFDELELAANIKAILRNKLIKRS